MAKKPKKAERKQKLKVFRTPIGFHDAYVAAPSQKAALEAWGAEGNLFAQGIAEQVTDPELVVEPLANPGEIIRKLRGSEAEHVEALGKQELPRKKAAKTDLSRFRTKPPKPSRALLDEAEAKLETAQKRQRSELRDIEIQIQTLERERRTLQRRHEAERDELAQARDHARAAYKRAVRKWDG
jgi:hypothetical protein